VAKSSNEGSTRGYIVVITSLTFSSVTELICSESTTSLISIVEPLSVRVDVYTPAVYVESEEEASVLEFFGKNIKIKRNINSIPRMINTAVYISSFR
jgi:hypothetical protein